MSEQLRIAKEEEKFLAFGETSIVRMARRLLEWSEERGESSAGGISIPLHLTHTELAQAIGSNRETVTRILGNLTHHGLVERRSDSLVIMRPDALERLACSSLPRVTTVRDRDAVEHRSADLSM